LASISRETGFFVGKSEVLALKLLNHKNLQLHGNWVLLVKHPIFWSNDSRPWRDELIQSVPPVAVSPLLSKKLHQLDEAFFIPNIFSKAFNTIVIIIFHASRVFN